MARYAVGSSSFHTSIFICKIAIIGCLAVAVMSATVNARTGSGFVVHQDGWVVTCEHVIRGAASIRIELSGTVYEAIVVKSQPDKDLALLKIKGDARLRPLKLANPDDVRPGDRVRAYGWPLNVSNLDVTEGNIKGVAYMEIEGVGAINTIRTDASINAGNSGGPLVNRFAEIVGVVNSKLVGEEISNFGFATHVRYVYALIESEVNLEQIAETPRVEYSGADLYDFVKPSVCQIQVVAGPETPRVESSGQAWAFDNSYSGLTQLGNMLSEYESVDEVEVKGNALSIVLAIGDDFQKKIYITPKVLPDSSFGWLHMITYFLVEDKFKKQNRDSVIVKDEVLQWVNDLNKATYSCGYFIDSDGDLGIQSQLTFVRSVSLEEIYLGLWHFMTYGIIYLTAPEQEANMAKYLQ